jgi:hypothetical protein
MITEGFEVGEKAIAKKLGWSNDNLPLRKIDVEGTITSIKGISPNHNSIHKYEFTWSGGKFMNDGGKLTKIK